ncbi:MAG TPA: hypothetical protein EYN13_06435 [Methylococcales bacterium]|nr:hypothetical protein [Methylococcales bacterium]
MKYRPEYPEKAFNNLPTVRAGVKGLVHGYNNEHLHSAIKFVTAEQRHKGEDKEILVKRKCVYQQAKSRHPERWGGAIENWDQVDEVFLNPKKQKKVAA